MNEDLVLRVKSEGVAGAATDIANLKTGIVALRGEIDTLRQSGLSALAKDLAKIGRASASTFQNFAFATPQIRSMSSALAGYTQAAQAASQATASLRFGAAARSIGAGSTHIQQTTQAVQGLSGAASGAGGSLQSAGQASGGFASSLKTVYGQAQSVTNQIQMVADKVQDVITGIVSLAQEGAKIQQLEVAFYKIGGSLDKLNELRDLTGGIVSDQQLVKSFNMMNLFELPQKEIPKLMKLAQGASIAMGQTANKMINDIATAASRRSRMIADNMGIVVDPLKVMYGNYAAKIGKARDDLTDAEKTMAFTLNMIEKGGKQIELAGAAQANAYAKAAAEYQNASDTFKKGIADIVSSAGGLDILREGLSEVGAEFDSIGGGAATTAIKSIFGAAMEGAKLLPPLLKGIWPTVQLGLDLFTALAPLLRMGLELASKLTAGFVIAVRVGLIPFVNTLALVLKGLADVAEFAGLSGKALSDAADNFAKLNANTVEMLSGKSLEVTVEVQPQLSVGAQFEKDVAAKIKERQDKYKKESDLDLRLKLSLTGSSKAAIDSVFKEGEALILDRSKITQDILDKVAQQSVLELYKPDPEARKSIEQLLIEAVPEAFATTTAAKFAAVGERASDAFVQSIGAKLPSQLKGLSVQMVASSDALSRSLLSGMGAVVEDLAPGEAAKIVKSMASALATEAGKGEAEELLKALSSGLVKSGRGDIVTDAHSDADFTAMTAAQQVAVLQQRIADESVKFADKAAARIWDAQMAYEQTKGGIISVEQLIAKGSIGKVAEEFKLAFSPETLKGFKGELKLIDGAVSGMAEAIGKLKEKTYGEDAVAGAYGDILDAAKEAGLLKQQNPFALVSPSDIDAIMAMSAEIEGVGEKGEILTGSMGQAANAWRAAGGDVDAAKAALKSWAGQLQVAEQRLESYRKQLEGTGGMTDWIAGQIANAQNSLAWALSQTKTAAEQVSSFTDSKPNKGKKNKNDILEREELLGLTEYQKAIVAVNRQFHKDMKDAGKNLDLINAAQKIQAANIAKAQKEMWEPVLDGARQRLSDFQIALADQRIEAAKMLKDAQEELRINNLSVALPPIDPLGEITFNKQRLFDFKSDYIKSMADVFNDGSLSEVIRESISYALDDGMFGDQSLLSLPGRFAKDIQDQIKSVAPTRAATEEEKNIERQLSALRTEQEEKLSILTQGSEAYLAVKATFAEREAQLERQRSAITIEEEHKRVWAGAEAFAQLQSETANFNSYIDGMTQTAARNTAFFAEGLLGGMSAVKAAADQMSAIDQQLALGTIQASQAESKKMQAALGASGKFIAGFIKDQRAQAGVLGAMEIGHAAAAFAGNPIPDPWGGAAHLLAAAKYFAVSASGSGGGAGSRPEPPRRATALSNRDQKGGGRERQSREVTNIIIQPLSGEVIVRSANKAAAKNVNVKFHGGLMGGEFRRTDY